MPPEFVLARHSDEVYANDRLLDRIFRREGVGDILADGTHWASQRIGKGAEAFAHNTIKKHEQVPIKLGMLDAVYYLMYCTGEKGNITQVEGQFPQSRFENLSERDEFVKEGTQPKMVAAE